VNEIKCPKCGTTFQISEENYDSIVKQIRDREFEKELAHQEEQYKKDKENAIKITEATLEKKLAEELNQKELEITKLENELKIKEEETKNKLEKKFLEELNQKSSEIVELKHQIELKDNEKELAIKNTLLEKDKQIDSLNNEQLLEIVDLMLKSTKDALSNKMISFDITKEAKEYLLEKGTDYKYGARPLRRAIQRYVEDILSEMILRSELLDGNSVIVGVSNNELTFEFIIAKTSENKLLDIEDNIIEEEYDNKDITEYKDKLSTYIIIFEKSEDNYIFKNITRK